MMTNYDRLYADITSKRYPTGLVVKYVGVNSPYVLLGTFDGVGHPNVSKRQNTERDAAGNPRVYYQPRIASNRSVLATISFNQKGKVVQVRGKIPFLASYDAVLILPYRGHEERYDVCSRVA